MNENQHQALVVKWSQQEAIRSKWPELKLLFHIPNERICSVQQGANLKRMGVKRGVPDLCMPVARGAYHGLFIEMKTESGTATSDQKWWGDQLKAQGYMWAVCKGWESAVKLLEIYLNLPGGERHG